MAWAGFIIAFAAFLISHSVPVRPSIRTWLTHRLGQRAFTLLYSAISLCALAWLFRAADTAPYVEVWPRSAWQTYVPLVAMAGVCLILALTLGRPNPLSFGGSAKATFDPSKPGIIRLTRHPILTALAIWAFAHLPPNGDLAHVLVFGVFGAFALLGGSLIDRRKQRELAQAWTAMTAAIATVPVKQAIAECITPMRLIVALALWLALIAAHPVLFGVSPLP